MTTGLWILLSVGCVVGAGVGWMLMASVRRALETEEQAEAAERIRLRRLVETAGAVSDDWMRTNQYRKDGDQSERGGRS